MNDLNQYYSPVEEESSRRMCVVSGCERVESSITDEEIEGERE